MYSECSILIATNCATFVVVHEGVAHMAELNKTGKLLLDFGEDNKLALLNICILAERHAVDLSLR